MQEGWPHNPIHRYASHHTNVTSFSSPHTHHCHCPICRHTSYVFFFSFFLSLFWPMLQRLFTPHTGSSNPHPSTVPCPSSLASPAASVCQGFDQPGQVAGMGKGGMGMGSIIATWEKPIHQLGSGGFWSSMAGPSYLLIVLYYMTLNNLSQQCHWVWILKPHHPLI